MPRELLQLATLLARGSPVIHGMERKHPAPPSRWCRGHNGPQARGVGNVFPNDMDYFKNNLGVL